MFPKQLIDEISVGGKVYSVPVNIHRANMLWDNPKVPRRSPTSRRSCVLGEAAEVELDPGGQGGLRARLASRSARQPVRTRSRRARPSRRGARA